MSGWVMDVSLMGYRANDEWVSLWTDNNNSNNNLPIANIY